MDEIIIDIGSGNIKAYLIKNMREIKSIYLKNIMFKKNFSKDKGIAKEDEEELISGIKEIKKSNVDIQIHAYATSVFRMLSKSQFEELKKK